MRPLPRSRLRPELTSHRRMPGVKTSAWWPKRWRTKQLKRRTLKSRPSQIMGTMKLRVTVIPKPPPPQNLSLKSSLPPNCRRPPWTKRQSMTMQAHQRNWATARRKTLLHPSRNVWIRMPTENTKLSPLKSGCSSHNRSQPAAWRSLRRPRTKLLSQCPLLTMRCGRSCGLNRRQKRRILRRLMTAMISIYSMRSLRVSGRNCPVWRLNPS